MSSISQFQIIEKKYTENTRIEVFQKLMENPVPGTPRIVAIQKRNYGWSVYQEYIPGITLAERLRTKLYTKKEAREFCLVLCDILEGLHAHDIVHGDIKPENIVITPTEAVFLIDFDAAHFVKTEIGRDTILMGTPGFASPEQYGFGRSDFRSDIYAMGILLNVMITGQHPLYQSTTGLISYTIERCTMLDVNKRFQSVKELRKGIKHPGREFEFLPVGFRSLNPLKMLIAIIGYAMIFSVAIFSAENIMQTVVILSFLIGSVFLLFNYCGINEMFSKKPIFRFLTFLLLEFILFLGFGFSFSLFF